MSYPKVIFGPFSISKREGRSMLRVELHTNGDWRGTAEGEAELERVGSKLFNEAGDKLPKGSIVQVENDNWLYLSIPCATNETYRWIEDLKKMIPAMTGAVYNELGLSAGR
jgi:hypothetical protein